MFGVADYGAFVVTIIVFLLIPGPGNLALITSTGKGGVRGGLAATLGIIAGDQVLMWLAVAGVAALLTAYPAAFNAVQWLGAAYLAWLGAKMLFAKPGDAPVLNIKAGQYFRQACAITVLNPKAIVFMLAVLPQFLNPQAPLLMQYLVMGVTMICVDLIVMAGYTGLAARVLGALRSPRQQRVMNRTFGALFVGAAALLASVRRAPV